jgi:hypothetical protein
MKIYHKDVWGFLFFKRYSFYVEDEDQSLTEILVDKDTWDLYNTGDVYEKSKLEKKVS